MSDETSESDKGHDHFPYTCTTVHSFHSFHFFHFFHLWLWDYFHLTNPTSYSIHFVCTVHHHQYCAPQAHRHSFIRYTDYGTDIHSYSSQYRELSSTRRATAGGRSLIIHSACSARLPASAHHGSARPRAAESLRAESRRPATWFPRE